MEKSVYVHFPDKAISVNEDVLWFDEVPKKLLSDVLPENIAVDNLTNIVWVINNSPSSYFVLEAGRVILFETTEENYNKYIKPYADLWQAKKNQQQQEQEEAEVEYNRFENRLARALNKLNEDFSMAGESAHIKSSLGFTADANSTANENVNGLLITIGDGTVQFCDNNNQFHKLNKAQLETLRAEIIQNGQNLYAQKWKYRTAIEACGDNDQLDAVISSIQFTYLDFSASA
jgi:hypothetical protein